MPIDIQKRLKVLSKRFLALERENKWLRGQVKHKIDVEFPKQVRAVIEEKIRSYDHSYEQIAAAAVQAVSNQTIQTKTAQRIAEQCQREDVLIYRAINKLREDLSREIEAVKPKRKPKP